MYFEQNSYNEFEIFYLSELSEEPLMTIDHDHGLSLVSLPLDWSGIRKIQFQMSHVLKSPLQIRIHDGC
jgi:hypothetical protein